MQIGVRGYVVLLICATSYWKHFYEYDCMHSTPAARWLSWLDVPLASPFTHLELERSPLSFVPFQCSGWNWKNFHSCLFCGVLPHLLTWGLFPAMLLLLLFIWAVCVFELKVIESYIFHRDSFNSVFCSFSSGGAGEASSSQQWHCH